MKPGSATASSALSSTSSTLIENSYGVHVLDGDLAWWFVPVWFLKVRGIHDRILERLLQRLDTAPAGAFM